MNKDDTFAVESQEQQMKQVWLRVRSFDAPAGMLTTSISGRRDRVSRAKTATCRLQVTGHPRFTCPENERKI